MASFSTVGEATLGNINIQANAQTILSTYLSVMNKRVQIDGNRPKDVVFSEVDSVLSRVQKDKAKTTKLGNPISGISLSPNQATKKEHPTR